MTSLQSRIEANGLAVIASQLTIAITHRDRARQMVTDATETINGRIVRMVEGGLNQTDVADLTGLTQGQVSKIVRKSKPATTPTSSPTDVSPHQTGAQSTR